MPDMSGPLRQQPTPTNGARRVAGVQSFEVGLALLSLLAHQRRPMKITELAAQAGMAPGKAHRYLASLVRSGYASQNPESGLYSTGAAALDFSLSCLSTIEPIAIASAEARALCRRTGHTVALSVWGSFGPTVVRWEQPARPVMVNVGPGSVFPLLESATGRVFAAFYDEAVIKAHLQHLADATDKSEAVAGALSSRASETVEQVRKRGMARARGDFMSGLSAFCAPIMDHRDRLMLAMTVLDYSLGWDHRWEGETARALRESAARISASLGHGETQAADVGSPRSKSRVVKGRKRTVSKQTVPKETAPGGTAPGGTAPGGTVSRGTGPRGLGVRVGVGAGAGEKSQRKGEGCN